MYLEAHIYVCRERTMYRQFTITLPFDDPVKLTGHLNVRTHRILSLSIKAGPLFSNLTLQN